MSKNIIVLSVILVSFTLSSCKPDWDDIDLLRTVRLIATGVPNLESDNKIRKSNSADGRDMICSAHSFLNYESCVTYVSKCKFIYEEYSSSKILNESIIFDFSSLNLNRIQPKTNAEAAQESGLNMFSAYKMLAYLNGTLSNGLEYTKKGTAITGDKELVCKLENIYSSNKKHICASRTVLNSVFPEVDYYKIELNLRKLVEKNSCGKK